MKWLTILRSYLCGASACISAVPTGWISLMFHIEIFMEICREFENLVKVVQKYRAFYARTQIHLIVCFR